MIFIDFSSIIAIVLFLFLVTVFLSFVSLGLWISAVAIDGIELKVVAKVTVRTNLTRLVGGAGEETIIARVGESLPRLVLHKTISM